MYKYELPVEYSIKGTDEVKEKTIDIDILEYQNSYLDEVSHLQGHSRSEINKTIRPKKEQFVFECISKDLKNNEEMVSLIDPLVDKIDTYIQENNR